MRKTVIMILALVAGNAFAAPPVAATVDVIRAEFGLFDAGDPRELVFAPSALVPHRVGQRYGWIIEVGTAQRSLSVREEYVLPLAPQVASDPLSESLSVPLQRRNQVSQRQLVPVDGKIYGEWSVGPDEPSGHRNLQVVIEGQVAASFEFDVK
jgi:hypothetical protein